MEVSNKIHLTLSVIPGSTRNPVFSWIPAFAGMTPFPVINAPGYTSGLENLHEILLPEPVSWMPQTIGWYAVFVGMLFLAGWRVYRRLRRFRTNRYRRQALEELMFIERELWKPEKRAEALAEIPVLLKRTALSAFPRAEVANLSGEKWLAFLDKTMGGSEFLEGEGRLLPELAYAPGARISTLPDEAIGKLLQLARLWIKKHVILLS